MKQLNPLTGIHEHSIQCIIPNGGPKLAGHFESNSCNSSPNLHSATKMENKKVKKWKNKKKTRMKLIKFIKERPFLSHKKFFRWKHDDKNSNSCDKSERSIHIGI